MEYLPEDAMFEFHPNTLAAVRGTYGLDKPGAMEEAIDILEEWIRKQNHFTKQNFNRDYLERIIITTKGSVEKAKRRLDKLFTLRSLMPYYFKNYDIRNDFESIQDIITYVILPKMTEDHDRVYFNRVVGKKFDSKMFLDGYRFSIMLSEYARAHDYANAYHIVIDYTNLSVADMLANVDISDLRQAIIAQMDGYGLRVKSVHILVNSKFVDAVIAIAKQVVNEKIGKRIHTHKTLDTLYEHVPKALLPKEYGGNEKPLMELHAEWMKTLASEEFRKYWSEMSSARTDESLRQKDQFNEQYMGMPGTFRTLSVD